jgi:catechol 2,3-dioxygenase-like lactoylglutathione lyase family enzyme
VSTDGYDEPVFNHVGQATADMEKAVAFYEGVLGFAVERRLRPPDAATSALLGIEAPLGLEVVYLRRGPFVLELMQFHREGNPPWRERVFNEPGLTHLSISVVDLEATAAQVEAHGGTVVSTFPYAVMVRDPDGQLIELLTMDYRRQLDAGLG